MEELNKKLSDLYRTSASKESSTQTSLLPDAGTISTDEETTGEGESSVAADEPPLFEGTSSEKPDGSILLLQQQYGHRSALLLGSVYKRIIFSFITSNFPLLSRSVRHDDEQ
jgi:hypothetical protein